MSTRKTGRNRPVGRHGSTTNVTRKPPGRKPQTRRVEPRSGPMEDSEPKDGEDASVGMSVSLGQSAEFGSAKYEVTIWCTLPSGTSEDDRRETLNIVKDFVFSELDEKRIALIDEYELPFK